VRPIAALRPRFAERNPNLQFAFCNSPSSFVLLVAYCVAYRGSLLLVGLSDIALWLVGFASFAFELSYWFIDHHRS